MLDTATGLTFEEEGHVYRYNGVVVPGVTQLLDSLQSFAGVDRDVLEAAKHRGSDAHAMCHYSDENDLDVEQIRTFQPHLLPYLSAWQKFTLDCDPTWTSIERPVFHMTQRYAGTPDRIGDITYQRKRVQGAVIDLKTSVSSHPCWGLQTSAYANAAGRPTARRFSVQLLPDGRYKMVEWSNPDDWPAFLSLLTLRSWKVRNGL